MYTLRTFVARSAQRSVPSTAQRALTVHRCVPFLRAIRPVSPDSYRFAGSHALLAKDAAHSGRDMSRNRIVGFAGVYTYAAMGGDAHGAAAQ